MEHDDDYRATLSDIAKLYDEVRSIYIETEAAERELPPFAVDAIRAIPELTVNCFGDRERFWDAVETWQTLCNTIREARRVEIQSTVNEITIDEAIKKGGPLNLPVHRETLPPTVQRQLDHMEKQAAKDFIEMGMDPCIDFQALLSCRSHSER
eukprot:CAMPEP_0195536578 /NCGR_PEP_ID=MMETSP0794_2-20130614/46341_1 /TAXON_ID=515487 /ORGANISM="Stephanopyxis turris, Strain CCMP 815" /LENGTH=152 /DNA_ID=CAMNT_0040670031 /DNA_START=12 /DNA_END=467 /DNA_ORIENTATION=+